MRRAKRARSNWNSATTYNQSWNPKPHWDTRENHEVSGLNPGTTYWFAIKSYDSAGKYSNVSNSPRATTLSPPWRTTVVIVAGLGTVAMIVAVAVVVDARVFRKGSH